MFLKKLTVLVGFSLIYAFGVFFAALLAFITANDGIIVLNMNHFGEMWLEYWLALFVMSVAPYVYYYVFEVVFNRKT